MNVLILLGSLRADSFNALLARELVEMMPEGMTASIYDGLGELPHYNEELDGEVVPAPVAAFRGAADRADAVVVVTPEYNGAVSSVIKNALDWGSRPYGVGALKGKPAVVFSATGSPRGGEWARENAARILTVAGAEVAEDTVGIPSAYEVFTDGKLTDSHLRNRVAEGLAQLNVSLNA
ncbi:MAG TPA: NAD(P)H-dependent oxidoreductase [Propionibacterium sp.]|jgi:NAD(P)H-dependent FMN reductase|nr:NAD(P)H-dependent oxidoreductase [Propionibacterium sp.]